MKWTEIWEMDLKVGKKKQNMGTLKVSLKKLQIWLNLTLYYIEEMYVYERNRDIVWALITTFPKKFSVISKHNINKQRLYMQLPTF